MKVIMPIFGFDLKYVNNKLYSFCQFELGEFLIHVKST